MDALKRKMEIAAVAFFCTVTALIAAYSCATTAAANLAQQTAEAPATEYVTLAYMEVQPEAEQEPELLYDVPMSDELQRYIREQAERQGVPFEIALAVIERESSYQPDAVSDTGDFGLMQIKMRLIREAFKKAAKVIVYITESGTAATGAAAPLTVTAKYGGARGNDIHVSVVTNPVGGFDVTVYLDADATAVYEGVKTVEELIAAAADDKLVKFTGTGDLKAASGVKLAGGTNVTSANGDVTAFVDKMEGIKFNTLCFPVTDATLQTAAITKIKYMRESMGKSVNAIMPDAKSPDHEGIINVTNSVVVDGVELTHAEACAFVAGITASASCIKSNTYEVYNGATGIVDPKDNEAAIAAIKNGEMFFSYSEAGNVIIEYDINSLVSFKKPKDKTYSKNRVIRTLDAIQETIQNNFPPNKYDNSPTGYAVMKGIGQTILKQYEDMGAIKNVDYDADFKIDESLSSGDEVYFIVAIQPVDSAEKLFFTVKTR